MRSVRVGGRCPGGAGGGRYLRASGGAAGGACWRCSGLALQREIGACGRSGGLHRHRVPLGLVMLAQGWITHPQLQAALECSGRAAADGLATGWCGVRGWSGAGDARVERAVELSGADGARRFCRSEMALVMPREFVEEFGVVPLRVGRTRVLQLGCEDQAECFGGLAVEKMPELKVQSGLVTGAQLRAARQRLLECRGGDGRYRAVGDADALAARITALLEQKQPLDSRLVRLHRYYWLRLWLESGTKGRAGSLPTGVEDMQDYVFTIGA